MSNLKTVAKYQWSDKKTIENYQSGNKKIEQIALFLSIFLYFS